MTSKVLSGCEVLPPMESKPPAPAKGRSSNKGSSTQATGQRFAILNAFVDNSLAGLSRVEALTWLVLYRDTRDGTVSTSIESIAARIGASKRATVSAINHLRERGLLIRILKGGINRGPSRYRVVGIGKPPD